MAHNYVLSPDILASLPPNVLNNLPAMQPPKGLQSNFASSENNSGVFKSAATFLFCLMTIFFANRVYTKVFIIRMASWDDLTCTLGFLGSMAMYISCFWGVTKGSYGKHQWDVRVVDFMSKNFFIPLYIMTILGPPSLLFIKLSFFLFYYQVFQPLRWLRISVYFGAILTCAFYGAATIAQLILATPKPGQTWINLMLSVPLSAVGLGIDIVLLAMPIGAVSRLQLPTKRKIGILSIFMFGLLACVGSTLSLYYRVVAERSMDTTWNYLIVLIFMLLEMDIGIVCLCLPSFSKMLRHHLPTIGALRSRYRTSLAKFWSSKSEKTVSNFNFTQSGSRGPPATSKQQYEGPHVQLDNQPSQPQNLDPTYELGQVKSVQPFIRRCDKEASDDKIRLTHEIEQQQDVVREKDLKYWTCSG